MLVLTCSSKLATLRRLLTHNFPESLKVCGSLHHVINGNPFGLQVLVDQWPDFSSVICRPALEDMKDPSDHYTNTYFLYSKDPHNLRQLLQDPQVVNWRQNFQIHDCQPTLGGVLQEVSSKYGGQMHTISDFLYMRDGITDEDDDKINSISDLHFSSLIPDEAHLVNAAWSFGGNSLSEQFIRRCIQTFPTMCMRKRGQGPPQAWVMTEQSCELCIGYTEKLYRGKGVFRTMIQRLTRKMDALGAPLYCHVSGDNKRSQAATVAAGFSIGNMCRPAVRRSKFSQYTSLRIIFRPQKIKVAYEEQ
ncbi:glycine N-acyltransferase-like [Hyperolius riggenbachi]|uniref:glycine N-acyltransferase-like n=1 Tax=Hyperolius riggenbachi TaxID=752182 RepID=UPI0035A2AB18